MHKSSGTGMTNGEDGNRKFDPEAWGSTKGISVSTDHEHNNR